MRPQLDKNECMDSEGSFRGVVRDLYEARRTIVSIIALVTLIGVVYALLATKYYQADVVILPPQQQQSAAAAMISQLGGLAGGASAALGLKNPSDIYIGMLKSRAIADRVIQTFKLRQFYGTETLQDTRRALAEASNISSNKEGLITISVEDKDPKRAADIANAYVDGLRQLMSRLATSNAGQRRLFYEQQLAKTRDQLAIAEVRLADVQRKTGILELKSQGEATVKAIATLRAEIAAREVQLESIRQVMTPNNPERQRQEAALAEMRKQFREAVAGTTLKSEYDLPRSAVPVAGLEYARAMREVKYNELLMETLAKQYEIARLDEANEGALVQVLDVAKPPEVRSRPKRGKIVVTAFLAGFLASLLWFLGKRSLVAHRVR